MSFHEAGNRLPDLRVSRRPPAAGLKSCGPAMGIIASNNSQFATDKEQLGLNTPGASCPLPVVNFVELFLFRVELDDKLFLRRQVDLLARGQR